jgi:hypothetical protein
MIKSITKHYIEAETVKHITDAFARKEYEIVEVTQEQEADEFVLSSPSGWKEFRLNGRRTITAHVLMDGYEITIKKVK